MGLNHGGGIHMFDQKDTTGILVGIGAALAVGLGVFAFFASSIIIVTNIVIRLQV